MIKKTIFNIVILDIDDLLVFNTTTNITQSILYQTLYVSTECFYLLYDNNNYSPILDIKKFLNVRGFCTKCQHAFTHADGMKQHVCEELEDHYKNKSQSTNTSQGKLVKDRHPFLFSTYKEEAQRERNAGQLRYIICDIEVNQEQDNDGCMTHKPNLIVAFEIIISHDIISAVEPFVDILKPIIFHGYDCVNAFVNFVMNEKTTY